MVFGKAQCSLRDIYRGTRPRLRDAVGSGGADHAGHRPLESDRGLDAMQMAHSTRSNS